MLTTAFLTIASPSRFVQPKYIPVSKSLGNSSTTFSLKFAVGIPNSFEPRPKPNVTKRLREFSKDTLLIVLNYKVIHSFICKKRLIYMSALITNNCICQILLLKHQLTSMVKSESICMFTYILDVDQE